MLENEQQHHHEVMWIKQTQTGQKTAFGHIVNPHLFRHSAATTIAIERPKQVKMASAILGNTPTTAGRHYNLANTIDAATRHQDELAKLRRKCRSGKGD